MAARRRKGASGKAKSSEARATGIPGGMMEGLQQIWLAGVGALSRAQREGPAAFQEAVTEGLRILDRSRSGAERLVREAIDTAQGTVQSRLDDVMTQANQTWDGLELLFQNRVQQALTRIGVPTADEVRALTRRVAELNDSVKALSKKRAAGSQRTAPGQRTAARPARGRRRA
jgi:poly(hydroxyalkanoate) granule-associated protein